MITAMLKLPDGKVLIRTGPYGGVSAWLLYILSRYYGRGEEGDRK